MQDGKVRNWSYASNQAAAACFKYAATLGTGRRGVHASRLPERLSDCTLQQRRLLQSLLRVPTSLGP